MRNDDRKACVRNYFARACQQAAAHHFTSVLYRKRRTGQKAKSHLALEAYMLLSASSVNPDPSVRSGFWRAVGQISQGVSRRYHRFYRAAANGRASRCRRAGAPSFCNGQAFDRPRRHDRAFHPSPCPSPSNLAMARLQLMVAAAASGCGGRGNDASRSAPNSGVRSPTGTG